MTTLVTGSTGFVGSAVARLLRARGEELRFLVRKGSDRRNIEGIEAELVEGDLGDPESLARAVKNCRAVFHVAADYRLWVPDPPSIYKSNVEGSRDLVRAAAEAGATRIVYTSSVATLGLNKDARPADEETAVALGDMIGHYKRSKFLAEEAVREEARARGAPVVIVNPSTPVGPRDIKPTPTGRLIVEAASGRMPAFVDTGLNIVHVEDVAAGHLAAYDRGRIGERYVLGGQDMSLEEILRAIALQAGLKPPGIKLPHGLVFPIAALAEGWARLTGGGEPFVTIDGIRMARKRMFFSSAKAERELGYKARPAQDAIRDALGWFREQGYLVPRRR